MCIYIVSTVFFPQMAWATKKPLAWLKSWGVSQEPLRFYEEVIQTLGPITTCFKGKERDRCFFGQSLFFSWWYLRGLDLKSLGVYLLGKKNMPINNRLKNCSLLCCCCLRITGRCAVSLWEMCFLSSYIWQSQLMHTGGDLHLIIAMDHSLLFHIPSRSWSPGGFKHVLNF